MWLAVLGVVDQWAQLLRDNLELGRVQLRDNGAEVGGRLDVGHSSSTSSSSSNSPLPHHSVACIVYLV
jgi:hypothetical protein